MARSLRIEFSGALYHITSRGDGQENIYLSDVCRQCDWICYSYCLMSNHYPLLIETPQGNLSKGMQLLNGVMSFSLKMQNTISNSYRNTYF
jgi:putative transposase